MRSLQNTHSTVSSESEINNVLYIIYIYILIYITKALLKSKSEPELATGNLELQIIWSCVCKDRDWAKTYTIRNGGITPKVLTTAGTQQGTTDYTGKGTWVPSFFIDIQLCIK